MAEQDVDIVRSSFEAFGRGDFGAVLETMDPEIEWRDQDSLPWGGSHRGHDAFGRHMQDFVGHFEEVRVEPERFLDAGDGVVVVTGRLRGRSSGGEVDVPVVQVWELRNGKVIRVESHNDSAAVLRAIAG